MNELLSTSMGAPCGIGGESRCISFISVSFSFSFLSGFGFSLSEFGDLWESGILNSWEYGGGNRTTNAKEQVSKQDVTVMEPENWIGPEGCFICGVGVDQYDKGR